MKKELIGKCPQCKKDLEKIEGKKRGYRACKDCPPRRRLLTGNDALKFIEELKLENKMLKEKLNKVMIIIEED